MKNVKCRFIVCWAVVLLLTGFYCTMLILGANPKVGIEYRMYYITHELSDWPGFGKLSYELGTVEYCTELKDREGNDQTLTVCQRKGQGFGAQQYEGSVSIGEASYIYYLPAKSLDFAMYQFIINGFSGSGEVSVFANDEQIGTFSDEGVFQMPIENITRDELLTIKFVTDNCSFRLWSISLNEV